MSYKLNDKIANLIPYEPVKGNIKIRMDANESFINADIELISDIVNRISDINFNRYPDPISNKLCKAISRFFKIEMDTVTVGNGSDELISIIISAFLMKNEKIVTLAPDFSMYRFYSLISEANCLNFQKENDMSINIDKLIEFSNNNDAKLIIFSNPCNPTSIGVKKEEVRRLVKSVSTLVVVDEAYMDFWNQSLLDDVNNFDNLIILKTMSKALGMAAIRLGFAVANKSITNILRAAKSPYNVNSLTQEIGCCILDNKMLLSKCINDIVKSKDFLFDKLSNIKSKYHVSFKMYNSCTNFLFVETDLSEKIFNYLLKMGIAVRLIDNNHLRISAGTIEENKTLIDLLNKFFRSELQYEQLH